MTKRRLPKDVIEMDQRLEREQEQSRLALGELYWHWTLDQTNEKRITEYEYARLIGRDESTVRQYALAYQNYRRAAASGARRTMEVCLDWAAMRLETEAATQAVADAHGIGFTIARQEYQNEVRRVREIARRRVEVKGTSIATEVPGIAERIAREVKRRQMRARRDASPVGGAGLEPAPDKPAEPPKTLENKDCGDTP